MKGTVKFYKLENNFGFIVPDQEGPDIYFKRSGLVDQNRVPGMGSKVRFDVQEHPKGPVMVNIKHLV